MSLHTYMFTGADYHQVFVRFAESSIKGALHTSTHITEIGTNFIWRYLVQLYIHASHR